MKLYDYKNQLSRFFNEFNKVNIPFAEIKGKLSAAGIVAKDSEGKGDLFDTIQGNSDQLKEAITKLNAMLEEDEKNKTNQAEAFFTGTFRPILENISKEQTTLNLETGKDETLCIQGRHDPCIVPRAVPVVEAVAAIAVYDALLSRRKELQNG